MIATTGLGAKAGFVVLWLILLSCGIKVALQLILGRYAIATGKTSLPFLNEIPGFRVGANWIVWLYVVMTVFTNFQQGAMLGGVAMVMNLIVPDVGVMVFAGVVAVVIAALLSTGGYGPIERTSMAMMAVLTLATLVCVGLLQTTPYAHSAADLLTGLRFELPLGGLGIAH